MLTPILGTPCSPHRRNSVLTPLSEIAGNKELSELLCIPLTLDVEFAIEIMTSAPEKSLARSKESDYEYLTDRYAIEPIYMYIFLPMT